MNMSEYPKYISCNAPLCPLDPDLAHAVHLHGERVCLWVREMAKYQLPREPSATSPLAILVDDDRTEPSIEALIGFLRFRSAYPHREHVAIRVEHLMDSRDDERDAHPLSIESLNSFIRFLEEGTFLVYPDIVLTTSGNIRAEWHLSWGKHFATEFLNSGEARFVIFAPDPKIAGRTMRLGGEVSVDGLLETVSPQTLI